MKTDTKNLKPLTVNPSKVTNAQAVDRSQPKVTQYNNQTGLPKINPVTKQPIIAHPKLRDNDNKPVYDNSVIRMQFEGDVTESVDKSVITIKQLAQISELYKASDRDLMYTDKDKNGLSITHYVADSVYYKEESDLTHAIFKHPYTPKPTPTITLFAESSK